MISGALVCIILLFDFCLDFFWGVRECAFAYLAIFISFENN